MDQVFFKTAKGREALEARSVVGKLRIVFILINGQDSLQTLHAKLGPETVALVHELQRLGHVETRYPQNQQVPKSPADTAGMTQLRALQKEAIKRLIPHFGPDAEAAAKPLLDAANLGAFFVALKGIEQRLAIYVGKAQAARILAGLRS